MALEFGSFRSNSVTERRMFRQADNKKVKIYRDDFSLRHQSSLA